MLRLACFCLLLALAASEDEDATVEFSSPLSDTPIENAEKATIVTSDEEEVTRRLPGALYNTPLDDRNTSRNDNDTVVEGVVDEKNVSTNATEKKTKVECSPRVLEENEVPTVQLANSSVLLKVLAPVVNPKNVTAGACVVVLFYSNQCVFSARMAPHFNALPRVFPDITFYAVDVVETGNLYVRYGLVYVPNVMLFHNSKPFARYNETVLNLDQFVKFINKYTGLQHNGTLNVTSVDMSGPVPSTLVKRVDPVLVVAWAFFLGCLCLGFARSSLCRRTLNFLRTTWYEANDTHHQHQE